MNIFLTGGTGLIGHHLIKTLLNREPDIQITVLTRQAEIKSTQNINYVGSIDSLNFCDFDVIINLAGEPIADKRWTDTQKNTLCQSRWQLTESLATKINEECKPDSPIRFISGSAVGFYGRQSDKEITENNATPYEEFSHKLCKKWEEHALNAKHANVALLRTGVVLSREAGALAKMLLPFKLGLGGKTASGKQYFPWIHIDDMVSAIIHLIKDTNLNGPFNVCAPSPPTNKEFSLSLAKTLKRPAIFPMPEFVLRILFGEMADLLVYGQRTIPERLTQSNFEFKFTKLEQALANLLLRK